MVESKNFTEASGLVPTDPVATRRAQPTAVNSVSNVLIPGEAPASPGDKPPSMSAYFREHPDATIEEAQGVFPETDTKVMRSIRSMANKQLREGYILKPKFPVKATQRSNSTRTNSPRPLSGEEVIPPASQVPKVRRPRIIPERSVDESHRLARDERDSRVGKVEIYVSREDAARVKFVPDDPNRSEEDEATINPEKGTMPSAEFYLTFFALLQHSYEPINEGILGQKGLKAQALGGNILRGAVDEIRRYYFRQMNNKAHIQSPSGPAYKIDEQIRDHRREALVFVKQSYLLNRDDLFSDLPTIYADSRAILIDFIQHLV